MNALMRTAMANHVSSVKTLPGVPYHYREGAYINIWGWQCGPRVSELCKDLWLSEALTYFSQNESIRYSQWNDAFVLLLLKYYSLCSRTQFFSLFDLENTAITLWRLWLNITTAISSWYFSHPNPSFFSGRFFDCICLHMIQIVLLWFYLMKYSVNMFTVDQMNSKLTVWFDFSCTYS